MPQPSDVVRELLAKLALELQECGLEGIEYDAATSPMGQPSIRVRVHNKKHVAHVEVVWPLSEERCLFYPVPGIEPHYRLGFSRAPMRNICATVEQSFLATEASAVVDGLRLWKLWPDDVPGTAASPLSAAQIGRCRAEAAARRAALGDASFLTVSERARELRAWTDDDVRDMARRIAVAFPREADGRLPLGVVAALARIGDAPVNDLLRAPWLVAAGPAKRRDPQQVTIDVQEIILANHPHRWDSHPAIWDPALPPPSDADRWGVAGLDLSRLGLEDRDTRIAALSAACEKPDASEAERAMLCILLQDAGRLGEALALFGLRADDDIWRIVSGDALTPAFAQHRAAWAESVCEALRTCAPWTIRRSIAADVERQKAWAAEKKGRRRQPPRFRLFHLPHQPQQSKVSLMLTAETVDGDRPRFDLEASASNFRLPEVLWKRSGDLDLRRFGLWTD
jgi:hypothetical protein